MSSDDGEIAGGAHDSGAVRQPLPPEVPIPRPQPRPELDPDTVPGSQEEEWWRWDLTPPPGRPGRARHDHTPGPSRRP
ncbi:hypothetical protein [Streptomyces acidicola]|uniref:hypothetical protein n=1 Tax=Streptomyces acidicola TaxID=2596892 RepID=UPI003446A2BE